MPPQLMYGGYLFLIFHLREIGDMDKGVIEGGKDTGDAEDEFTCAENN